MGLRDDIQSEVALAFDTDLADAVSDLVLTHFTRGSGSYSTTDGSYTNTSTEHSSRGVFGSYEQVEISNSAIEPTDVKLTVLQNEIDIEPNVRDTITKENSNSFRVVTIGKDPADATWVIQLRSIES